MSKTLININNTVKRKSALISVNYLKKYEYRTESEIIVSAYGARGRQHKEDQPAQASALFLRFGFLRLFRLCHWLFDDHRFRLRFLLLLQKFFEVIFIERG